MTVADATAFALRDRNVLVTGGAGSIGSNLVLKLLESGYIKEVVAFDNNEYALACLKEEASGKMPQVAFGDIRDSERLQEVLSNIDIVVHTAALKRVEMAEPNIAESIKVNVLGTMTLLQECRKAKVRRFLLISSDKAVPIEGEISNYGATKLLQERITLSSKPPPLTAVARFGNVIGTRGDVFEIWRRQWKEGKTLTITHPNMKRFFWTMEKAVNFIINCLEIMEGHEIFVPEMEEHNLMEEAIKFFGENVQFQQIGLRPGEVLKHKLMTDEELRIAKREPWGWVIKRD